MVDSELFFQFIQDTQSQKWQDLQEMFGEDAEEKILQGYQKELREEPLIRVIRRGFSVSGIQLDCLMRKPVSELNPDARKNFEKNALSVIRQVRFDDQNHSVDLLLCLNGIPVATAELKNPATGQTYLDAIQQYKEDRDPENMLFEFKRGALVHFAIDPHETHMSTHLQGNKTRFLPFNKGKDGGKGNPTNPDGYETAYIWEQIWQRDSWVDIISDFIELQTVHQKEPLPDKEVLIFPRYHQIDTVTRLVNATIQNGTGTNYLVQHSPGSGKSNTIAWLAYKMLSVHDKEDNAIFHGVIVLSDRVGIVNQLGETIGQFEQTAGTVSKVETSNELAQTLANDRKVVVTTQQKFPFVLDYINQVRGKKYAIVIDEAHSSQSAESRTRVQEVLTSNLQEQAEKEAHEEEAQEDIIQQIQKEMETRGQQNTLSYYAFTATPKKDTLRLFGTRISEDDYVPFHTYSMRQAIEEGFILDVLKNYTTYERQFRIVQTSEDMVVEKKKAAKALLKYVNLHFLNLEKKSEVIVEHFRNHTLPKIGGQAKSMVVGSSRAQALKYKREIDEYVKKKGYRNINTLIAFSGSLKDEAGNVYTENSLNQTRSDKELREKFDTPEFNVLIVTEKYQTGFDQPLLHTMYVDKALHGIKAVQTLSRLNRTHAGKIDTFVVDFVNTIDDIRSAFAPYYESTLLVDNTDTAYMTNLYDTILNTGVIREEDLDKFAEVFFKLASKQTEADHGKLYAVTSHILERFDDADEKVQDDLRAKIIKYIESYVFLTQVLSYDDTNFEKLYAVLKFVVNENMIKNVGSKILDLTGDVSLQWYRLEKTYEGDILLDSGPPIKAGSDYGAPKPPEVLTTLADVIAKFNEFFGGKPADEISFQDWLEQLKNIQHLREIAQENSFEDFYEKFEKQFLDVVISSETNLSLVKKIFSEHKLQSQLIILASKFYHEWVKTNNLPPITPSDPARNRQVFRQSIYRCKGSISWLDLYLNEAGLDFLIDSFDRKNVRKIRLLTGLHSNKVEINEKLRAKFLDYKEELARHEITLEMRIVAAKNGYDNIAHDRYMLGDNVKYNTVSFVMLQKGRFSEIKETKSEIPFDQYWDDKNSLDLESDWDKIIKHGDDI